jgi:hypothetical protein
MPGIPPVSSNYPVLYRKVCLLICANHATCLANTLCAALQLLHCSRARQCHKASVGVPPTHSLSSRLRCCWGAPANQIYCSVGVQDKE